MATTCGFISRLVWLQPSCSTQTATSASTHWHYHSSASDRGGSSWLREPVKGQNVWTRSMRND